MLRSRDLWSDSPPEPRSRLDNYPTLLFSWWCTGFATVIILVRVAGRKIRVGRIFTEDKLALFSLVPLLIRMGLVHVILLFGTNNVQLDGITPHAIWSRSIGSRCVLASRIFYAMYIWVSKVTVSEFLKRLARASWRKSYERGLHFIRIFLLVTFIAVVIATLSECQPFDHYWQVVPDPGPRCRQGFAQLITMGIADIITDILLVCWPIPIIVRSGMPLKRKVSLVLLFSLSLGLIGITGCRVPEVIKHQGRQQYRTVWASAEILASAAVSNSVVLGSFVRDRGIKRNKYRRESTLDSMERTSTRRPTLVPTLGDSDEDLFRAIGCRIPRELQETSSPVVRPAPVALPVSHYYMSGASPVSPLSGGQSCQKEPHESIPPIDLESEGSEDCRSSHVSSDTQPKSEVPLTTVPSNTRSVSFFDVGGLLEDGPLSNAPLGTHSSQPSSTPQSGFVAYDFASTTPLTRRSSRNIFGDLSNMFSSGSGRRRSSQLQVIEGRERGSVATMAGSGGVTAPRKSSLRPTQSHGQNGVTLQDVGGLLK